MKKTLDRIGFFLRRLVTRKEMHPKKGLAKDPTQNPYPGLTYYTEQEEKYFHGRSAEKNSILEMLEYYSLCLLIGKSGIGKSSLVNAGLIPELLKRDFVPVTIRINFDAEVNLTDQVKSIIIDGLRNTDPDIPPFGDRVLWEYFQEVRIFNGFLKPVLIFDQFEEIFTRAKDRQAELIPLLRELIDLSENRVPEKVQQGYISRGKTIPSDFRKDYRLMFVMREDYLPQLTGLRAYIPTLKFSIFRLEQMTVSQAKEAVYLPAKEAKLMEEKTADRIVGKIPPSKTDEFEFSLAGTSPITEKEGLPSQQTEKVSSDLKRIEPFLLNLFCYTLNIKRFYPDPDHPAPQITAQDVDRQDFGQLVKEYYERISGARRGAGMSIEAELVTPDGKYRQFSAKENFKQAGGISDEVVEYLVARKLIRRRSINELEYYELIHDVLIPIVVAKRKSRAKRSTIVTSVLFFLAGLIVFGVILKVINNSYEIKQKGLEANLALQKKLLSIQNNAAAQVVQDQKLKDSLQTQKDQHTNDSLKNDLAQKEQQAIAQKALNDKDTALLNAKLNEQMLLSEKSLDAINSANQAAIDLRRAEANREQERTSAAYNASITYAKSSTYPNTPVEARNTLALLSFDTLNSVSAAGKDFFNPDVYSALAGAVNINYRWLGVPIYNKYKSVDAAIQRNHRIYYICPFLGINVSGQTLFKDDSLVHGWVSGNGEIFALQESEGEKGNILVIKDSSGRTLREPVHLATNEDVISVLFNPRDKICLFSTRRQHGPGYLNRLSILGNADKDSLWLAGQNEYLFLADKGAGQFTAISNKGRVFEGQGFGAGSKFIPTDSISLSGPVSAISPVTQSGSMMVAFENGDIYRLNPSGKLSLFFSQQSPRITSISASPDGKWVAAGNYKGEVQLWKIDSVQSGCALAKKPQTKYASWSVSTLYFSENCDSLVAIFKNSYTYSVPLSLQALADKICADKKLLTKEDWDRYVPNLQYRKLCN